MTLHNVLLMWGGAGAEHEISQLSAAYIEQSIAPLADINVLSVELLKDGYYKNSAGELGQLLKDTSSGVPQLQFDKGSRTNSTTWPVDFVIPCFHGFPGESGDIQSMLELMHIPYLGCHGEASILCFNKVSTKLWLDALGIPNTPYIVLSSVEPQQLAKAQSALQQWQSVFVKASSQGSSVGCYQVEDTEALNDCLQKAFALSPYVLIEPSVNARELEVAVYEYDGELVVTLPGEIVSPEGVFYTYEEKYHEDSRTETQVVAENLSCEQIDLIKRYAAEAFRGLKLRHLSRIDYFLTHDGMLYINEINTLPGLTPISMFPKMMQHHGHQFADFIAGIVRCQHS